MKTIIPSLAGATVAILSAGLAHSSSAAVISLDLLTANSSAAGPSGSFFKQVGTGAGTGNWDPFLSLDSKKGELSGYNTDANANVNTPDIVTGGGRTHAVTFGQLRYTTSGGIDYVRFSLDINEPGNVPEQYLALNDFRIYAPTPGSFANYNGTLAGLGTPIYDMDTGADRTVLMDYKNQTGSGVSDMDLFVPLSIFNGLALNRSIVVYTRIGDGTGVGHPTILDSDWGADAGGFEEWRLSTTDTPVPVPEPATVAFGLAMVGGLGMLEFKRRQKRASSAAV